MFREVICNKLLNYFYNRFNFTASGVLIALFSPAFHQITFGVNTLFLITDSQFVLEKTTTSRDHSETWTLKIGLIFSMGH